MPAALHKSKPSWTIVLVLAIAAGVVLLFRLASWPADLTHRLAGHIAYVAASLDYRIMSFLNRFAHRSWTLDTLFFLIDDNWLATAPLLGALWWFWFNERKENPQKREFLLCALIAPVPAVLIARLVAFSMPFRERPLRNAALHFQLPYHVLPERLLNWSSFPSDSAAVWFALAVGILFVSRRAGAFLLAYVSLTLAFSRIYLGIHYPSDILAGGLIGASAASLARYPAIRTAVTRWPLQCLERAPQVFYTCFFLITAGMSERFAALREVAKFAGSTFKAVWKML